MHEPPRHFIELVPGVSMAFRLIPPGEFRMGQRGELADEEPVHRVRIAHPFGIAETPVTQEQFAVWTRAAGVAHENHFQGRPRHPAESMDWNEATAFCDWITERCRVQFPEGMQRAALPSEAQWEYACRAGTETEYHTGDGEAALREAGWFGENWDTGSTHPVGEKAWNDFWLHDMHGNVSEWCSDLWNEHAYREQVDGWVSDADRADKPAEEDPRRVVRGGSWGNHFFVCRSAVRLWHWASYDFGAVGFRPVLVLGSLAQDEGNDGNEGKASRRPKTEGEGRARSLREPTEALA
jgi:formylglycine-generating enzyme required for sulfatase activity